MKKRTKSKIILKSLKQENNTGGKRWDRKTEYFLRQEKNTNLQAILCTIYVSKMQIWSMMPFSETNHHCDLNCKSYVCVRAPDTASNVFNKRLELLWKRHTGSSLSRLPVARMQLPAVFFVNQTKRKQQSQGQHKPAFFLQQADESPWAGPWRKKTHTKTDNTPDYIPPPCRIISRTEKFMKASISSVSAERWSLKNLCENGPTSALTDLHF